jgi:hypothetical protein
LVHDDFTRREEESKSGHLFISLRVIEHLGHDQIAVAPYNTFTNFNNGTDPLLFFQFFSASDLGAPRKMAVRLSIAFDTSAESWLTQQTQYDLWHAEQGP